MSFEISIFEYSDLYGEIDTVKPEEVVQKFIQEYKRYLSPEYYPEDMVWFSRGRTWIAYADKTGGDKPMMVMLIGPGTITDELIAQIKDAVAKLYIKFCADCFKVLSKERARKWTVCHECANA